MPSQPVEALEQELLRLRAELEQERSRQPSVAEYEQELQRLRQELDQQCQRSAHLEQQLKSAANGTAEITSQSRHQQLEALRKEESSLSHTMRLLAFALEVQQTDPLLYAQALVLVTAALRNYLLDCLPLEIEKASYQSRATDPALASQLDEQKKKLDMLKAGGSGSAEAPVAATSPSPPPSSPAKAPPPPPPPGKGPPPPPPPGGLKKAAPKPPSEKPAEKPASKPSAPTAKGADFAAELMKVQLKKAPPKPSESVAALPKAPTTAMNPQAAIAAALAGGIKLKKAAPKEPALGMSIPVAKQNFGLPKIDLDTSNDPVAAREEARLNRMGINRFSMKPAGGHKV
jgi:hypothetical protein